MPDHEMPVQVGYFDHPKTLHLVGLLGPEADVYPLRLFAWAWKNAPSGVIRGGVAGLEYALRWRGKPGELHAALMKAPEGYRCGFIEADGVTIHDWKDGVGRAIAHLEAERKRKREAYDKARGEMPAKADKTETGPKEEIIRQLRQIMTQQKILGAPQEKRDCLEAWVHRYGAAKVQEVLMSSKATGQTCKTVERMFASKHGTPTDKLSSMSVQEIISSNLKRVTGEA